MIGKMIYNNRIMLIIGIVIFINMFMISGMRRVRADENMQYNKSFISIEIEEGDTLTSIAREYAISAAQYSDYIDEVKSINNLKSDIIHTGCYLMIPVYQLKESESNYLKKSCDQY